MNSRSVAEVLFVCTPETVWSVLTDADRYADWYGFYDESDIVEIIPGFEKGGIINFRHRSRTAVITEFEENKRLALSAGNITDTVSIDRNDDFYCTVKIETLVRDDDGGSQRSDALLEEMLEKLQEICYRAAGLISGDNADEIIHRTDFLETEISSGRDGGKNDTGSEDLTKSQEKTLNKGLAAAAILAVILSFVISATTLPDDGKYHQSFISGKDVYESSVSIRSMAEKFRIGQSERSVERELDCIGTEIAPGLVLYRNGNGPDTAAPVENIVVSYNAYGEAAEYTYINNALILEPLAMEYWDIKHELNSDMSFAAVEQIVERGLTAFNINRNGSKTLYFGSMDLYDGFSSKELRSELVIRLDPLDRNVEVNYYPPYEDRTGLPDSIEDNLVYQYRRDDVYIKDRDAFERIYTLLGRKRHEVDVVLGAGDYYTDGSGSWGTYCSVADSEHSCDYTIYFDADGAAEKIIYRNNYLPELQGTVKDPEGFMIQRGMTSREMFETVKMIPVYSELSKDRQILYFGDLLTDEKGGVSASLVIEIDKTVNAVSEIIYQD